ncbi:MULTISPECIES: FadR/GntR family transcriptional regulator [Ralstonia]|jgi:GntR family transcriptional repressor for pyruvate dehydrogenase complex|uniref:HTH-type transcriptional regulator LutR n=2 Tax=Ralstonia TaxID=48736 RepID=A0AAD2BPH5_9RALS|nr:MULTISPECIES: FadR/GntR family transcriptional regulator [Ralstonia]MBB0025125.1 FadR family transcriptional regulator [Ralstonia pickettii]MBB0034732.1 FadR family transcriptional regulator [Ralstonia pickettii]MBB0098288.1 FadR family transcriptional regulator [Ralstonia pickettii]MBB0108084.1 FadR family transcriptional regulator [Ralstonia pickettii]MBB0129227.1 FadR family transcriptional regulator [Ralstonia pickettii]
MPTASSPATHVRRTQSLADVVVDHIKGRIANESLRIGDKLPTESALMEALGVSRTVIREAISRLQAKGMIETRHGIGSFVLPPRADNSIPLGDASTMHDILSMLELRVAIETECAGLAAQRISPTEIDALRLALEAIEQDQADGNDSATSDLQFHLSIARATGNEHFVGALAQLGKTLIPRTRIGLAQVGYLNAPELRATVNREHHSVFEAIARKDPEAARAAMRMHLSNSRERLRRAHEAAGTQSAATGS